MTRVRRVVSTVVATLLCAAAIVLFWLPGAVEARFNAVVGSGAAPPGERAIGLHRALLIADLHADSLLWDRNLLSRGTRGQLDLPRLIEGNVALQVFSTVSRAPTGPDYQHGDDRVTPLSVVQGWPPRTWRSLRERTLYQAQRFHRAVRRSDGKLRHVRTAEEIDEILELRRGGSEVVGGLLAIEGLHALEGEIDTLDHFHEVGFRMMGLAHFFDNDIAGSSWGGQRHGLTAFGREVVARMEQLGIIVDLAHAAPKTIDDVLEIATRPVVVSHTGVQGTCPGPRNLDDDRLRRIAASGGLIGIGFFKGAVCGTDPARIAAAVRYAVDRVGVEHVGIGSDFDGAVRTAFDVAELVRVTEALINEGFTDAEIRRIMGGNALALLRRVLPESRRRRPDRVSRRGQEAARR